MIALEDDARIGELALLPPGGGRERRVDRVVVLEDLDLPPGDPAVSRRLNRERETLAGTARVPRERLGPSGGSPLVRILFLDAVAQVAPLRNTTSSPPPPSARAMIEELPFGISSASGALHVSPSSCDSER
jgi:hypothetical protein